MKNTRVVVVGNNHRPPYFQQIECGRHVSIADEPSQRGGLDAGPSPSAYLLSALGACTSVTLRMYCGKKGWAIETVLVSLELFGKPGSWGVRRVVQILGDLTREQSGRLAEVCERTPVTLAVRRGVNVQTTVSVQLPAYKLTSLRS